MIEQLRPADFGPTPEILRLAEAMSAQSKWPRPFNPDHFFKSWQAMMNLGMAGVWRGENALLGGLFVPNLFSGDSCGYVNFWWRLPGIPGEARELLDTFIAESRARKCIAVYSARFGDNRSAAMSRFYRRLGFEPVEESFRKFL